MDIFVAKLSSETTAENLTELFSQFGTVGTTKVIMDKQTGRSKCYGFVEMEIEQEAMLDIEELNNSHFMGYDIVVKKSHPSSQNQRPSHRIHSNDHKRGHHPNHNGNFDNHRQDNSRDNNY